MFKFSKRSAPTPGHDFEHSIMPSAANSSRPSNDVQRELVRVAFKDTLRATGVPWQWLDCEVNYVQDPRHGERVQIVLLMKRWSGHLLRYSLAFQQALTQCLDRYEPHVDHSKHEWVWKYSQDCETPFVMPAPEEWAKRLESSYEKPPVYVSKAVASTSVRATAGKPKATAAPPDKAFEMRDIFLDLTADQLKTK